jgi:hypothetical protein
MNINTTYIPDDRQQQEVKVQRPFLFWGGMEPKNGIFTRSRQEVIN